MKTFCLLVLCALAVASVAGIRRRRSAQVQLRTTPRLAVQEVTEKIRLDCRPSPSVDDVLMAVLISVEKLEDDDDITIIASRRIGADDVFIGEDGNRTTATGQIQESETDASSYLTVSISEPTTEDAGIYACRFVYLDLNTRVQTLAVKINVTVLEVPPPNYVPDAVNFDCDCDQIWTEIDSLKAALAKSNKGGGGGGAAAPSDTCRVSFSARFETRHGYAIVGGQQAVFDYIISDRGGAYDKTTGVFTAPCAGQYFFTLTMRSHQELDSGYVDAIIEVNGEAKARTSVFTDVPIDNFQSASAGVVLDLEEGAEVKVMIKSTSSGEFIGNEYSIFSGFYLSP